MTQTDWQERLRAQGYRLTPQRELVLAAVDRLGHGPPDEILHAVREHSAAVNISTIYRTLELLESLGLVWHPHLGRGAPVYHAAERPHLHVVCATCGEIASAAPDLLDEAAERLAADLGFTVDVGHVALSGTCRACRTRAAQEKP